MATLELKVESEDGTSGVGKSEGVQFRADTVSTYCASRNVAATMM
jgi:hypothetical protein